MVLDSACVHQQLTDVPQDGGDELENLCALNIEEGKRPNENNEGGLWSRERASTAIHIM